MYATKMATSRGEREREKEGGMERGGRGKCVCYKGAL